MARSAAFTISDDTVTSGQSGTMTLTFTNDSAAVTIVNVSNKVAGDSTAHLGDAASMFQNARNALVGAVMAAVDNVTPVDTVVTFPVMFFSGSKVAFDVSFNFILELSDGAFVIPTAEVVTVSPPTLP